jgi:hypothetical protein
LAAFHDGDAGVGGSQVDADNLAHDFFLVLYLLEITKFDNLMPVERRASLLFSLRLP